MRSKTSSTSSSSSSLSSTSSCRSWSSVRASQFASNTFNPIRNIVDTMTLTANPELELISLALGDPTIFGNLGPHSLALEAVMEALRSNKANGYAPSHGLKESRVAIVEYIRENMRSTMERMCEESDSFDASAPDRITSEDVVITSGCSSALDMCIALLANRGDNIVIPRPGFPLYKTLANGMGVETREYNLEATNDFEADLGHMASLIDERTRAIIVTNPSNPCGSVFSLDHLKDILDLAEFHCVPIIADEIYEHFVFGPDAHFVSMATLRSNVPILTCSGLTKRFLVPGWRTGWVTLHHNVEQSAILKELRWGIQRLSQRITGSNIPVQKALPNILKETPKVFFDNTLQVVAANARLAHDALNATPGLRVCSMPKGAMYMMVALDIDMLADIDDDLDLVQKLYAEQSVFCLPGKCFGAKNFVRIVLTLPQQTLSKALERIKNFCNQHVSNPQIVKKDPKSEAVDQEVTKSKVLNCLTDEDADSGADSGADLGPLADDELESWNHYSIEQWS